MPEVRVQDEQGNIHVFPDGSTPEMISQAMNIKPPDSGAKISAQPPWYSAAGLKSRLYSAADAATEALPAAGATVGALIGGGAGTVAEAGVPGPGTVAGGIGGAGVGGMGGEALRQLIRRALGFESPQTSADAAREITKQGVIQGGVQAASEVLPLAAGPLKRAAVGQYERALAPTTKINKGIVQDIAPEMIDRGLHGSLPALEEQAGQQAAAVRPQLNAAYTALPADATAGSGKQIVQDLETLKGRYIVDGKVAKPQAVDAITNVQDIVKQYGDDIAPESLRKLKQIFDADPAAAGAYAGADLATKYTLKAQSAAGNSIRNILHEASPDVAALDKEISFWLDVQRVTRDSGLRKTGQAGGLVQSLSPLAGGAAAAAGMYAGGAHASLESAGGVVLATLATKVVRSAGWRTMSAVTKDAFADALARGDVGQVAALATRLGIAGAQSPPPAAPESPSTPQQ